MRIISGKYKGRQLVYPKDKRVRPTQDRVKEALFSILGPQVHHAAVLDLFCGTGGLGIEALSRGASSCVFVDLIGDSVRKNLAFVEEPHTVFEVDFRIFLKRNHRCFPLIFMDPPWLESTIYEDSLKAIFGSDILPLGGTLVVEHPKKMDLSGFMEATLIKPYSYGNTQLSVITR